MSPTSPRDTYYYLAFNLCWESVGPVRFQQLLKIYGTAEEAWKAPEKVLRRLGWGEKALEKFLHDRKNVDIKGEMEKISKLGIRLITVKDKDYPENLKEIYDSPPLLYVRGNLKKEDKLALAVVGSRRMTPYGKEVTQNLVQDLVVSGLTIVSGLAFGVDYCAHKVALEAGGRVIAVLASGVDEITPRSNKNLGDYILKSGQGAIVSEFPLGTTPWKASFPVRNRIISGLALGTLVVEAAEKSGTFYTVKAALDQGREVFAVPGPIFSPQSLGPLNLIKEGAKLVTGAKDILDELEMEVRVETSRAKRILPQNPEEEGILKVLKDEEKHIDRIIRETTLPVGLVSATLTAMELKGMVKNIGGGVYRRVQ